MKNFNLETFTKLYLEDNSNWGYLYYKTFLELPALLGTSVDINEYLVQEVSINEMLTIIESLVKLEWFLTHDIGAAYVKKCSEGYELYYEGERGGLDETISKRSELRDIIKLKLKKDLFWIHVKKIKD